MTFQKNWVIIILDSKNIEILGEGGEIVEIGTKVKAYLESKGISQKFLSTKSGIPLARLNLSLNGKRKLTLGEYEAICWALGLGVDAFLEPKPPAGFIS